jgi:CheY-like chemotaxis protein
VLLVDDSPQHLEVAEDQLRRLGLIVETARHGGKAVELALRRRYALILMDVQMPVMDGLSATRQIRAALGPQPPIVALTAQASADDRRACELAGMDDHLSKPVEAATLYAALGRWLPSGSLPLGPISAPAAPAAAAGPGPAQTTAPPRPADPQTAEEVVLVGRLAAIAGFDLAGSLANLNGQLPRLLRVLRRFADAYRQGEPALTGVMGAAPAPDVPDTPDTALGWQLCHSLRGACATLCAGRLVGQVQQLEAALATPADIARLQACIDSLQAELIALAQALDGALRA